MARTRLLLLLVALTASACAPEAGPGFQLVDEPEADGVAFHTIVGQSAVEVAPGDEVFVFLASDPNAAIDEFSPQSFLACDEQDWSIEHTVAVYLAEVNPDALIDVLGDGLDLAEGDVLSGVGFVVAETVRSGAQMVVDPRGYDHGFDLAVVDPTL